MPSRCGPSLLPCPPSLSPRPRLPRTARLPTLLCCPHRPQRHLDGQHLSPDQIGAGLLPVGAAMLREELPSGGPGLCRALHPVISSATPGKSLPFSEPQFPQSNVRPCSERWLQLPRPRPAYASPSSESSRDNGQGKQQHITIRTMGCTLPGSTWSRSGRCLHGARLPHAGLRTAQPGHPRQLRADSQTSESVRRRQDSFASGPPRKHTQGQGRGPRLAPGQVPAPPHTRSPGSHAR